MKTKATINVWFQDRDFGFCFEEKDGAILRYFLHGNNIISGTPRQGAEVLFHSVVTKKGLLAVNAVVIPQCRYALRADFQCTLSEGHDDAHYREDVKWCSSDSEILPIGSAQ